VQATSRHGGMTTISGAIPRTAFITGVTGQDGSYLAELLLEKGYEVHGLVRRSSTMSRERLDDLEVLPESLRHLHLHYGDVTDASSLTRLVLEIEPDEVYNLAAQSHVRVSFEKPSYTADVNAMGCLRLLEAVRLLNERKSVRFYQASTSEMFGGLPDTVPQNEDTPFHPRSPYASSKVFAHHTVVNYREAYDLFACSGILFNHESPRRGENFVTRKITRAATRIKLGLQEKLSLGNLAAKRDWGYAKDYVEGMWRMLQHDEPGDFVLATGETQTVQRFVDFVFEQLELDPTDYIKIDPRYFRPAEVDQLLGDPSKAQDKLGWTATTSLEELAGLMVDSDLELARQEAVLEEARHV